MSAFTGSQHKGAMRERKAAKSAAAVARNGCRKVRYATEHAAQVALVGAVVSKNKGLNQRREQRHYLCPSCSGWHLTSSKTGNSREARSGIAVDQARHVHA